MSTRLLALVALLAGCDPTPLPPAVTQPPDLALLALGDSLMPATTGDCVGGLRATELPRGTSNMFRAVRTSAGVWHVVYTVSYGGFTGLRHVSSSDPTHADSIAWIASSADATLTPLALVIGADDVPTLFYVPWTSASQTATVEWARFVDGGWVVATALPYEISSSDPPLVARVDGAGHAWYRSGTSKLYAYSDGAWTSTDMARLFPGATSIVGIGSDGAGHAYVGIIGTNSLLASNRSGAWQRLDVNTDNAGLSTLDSDGKGDVHAFSLASTVDTLFDTDLTAGTPTRTLGTIPSTPVFIDGRSDGNGNPVLLVWGMTNFELWRGDANGANYMDQVLPLPSPDLESGLALDGAGGVHFALAETTRAAVTGLAQLVLVDACP